jgi:hypothetical protein
MRPKRSRPADQLDPLERALLLAIHEARLRRTPNQPNPKIGSESNLGHPNEEWHWRASSP